MATAFLSKFFFLVNLTFQSQDESSSDEFSATRNEPSGTTSNNNVTYKVKPSVPPRPKNVADHKRVVTITTKDEDPHETNYNENDEGNNFDLYYILSYLHNYLKFSSCKKNVIHFSSLRNYNTHKNIFDILYLAVSQQCTNIISQLIHTTTSVIQLHNKLNSIGDDDSVGKSRKGNMLRELEDAVLLTQTMLKKVMNR